MTLYKVKNFGVYHSGCDYIVYNSNKKFEGGHTHIDSLKTAKYIVKLSLHKSIPHNLSIYLLNSLIRLSDDNNYTEKISELLETKQSKTKNMYYNVSGKRKG